ncbi:MAG TPA: hypothetical protein DIU15_11845, partial [Deltaproteobacteria bacterium]|nr:hypothetical protein [Deltaproteobacteria bacterium]
DSGDDDDDDSADDAEVYSVTARYTFTYYSDVQNGIELCQQHIEVAGDANFGFGVVPDGECNNCTGYLDFDEATVTDVSNPGSNPDDCDPATLDAAGANFGLALLLPTGGEAGGFGDFLALGLVDADTMSLQGLSLAADGGYTAADIETALADFDLEFTHAGYVRNTPDTLASESGLDQVADNAGGTSQWFGYWQIFKNPTDNLHEGSDMNGVYGGQSVWQITFGG